MKTHTGIGDWIAANYELGIPFLQQVPRDCADYLLLNAQIREYDAGDVIINGGSVGDSFCVLQSGRAFICGELLADGTISTTGITGDDTDGLWREEDTTRGDVLRTTVLRFLCANRRESYFEDTDALQLHLLSHLEEVLHGTTKFVAHGNRI